MSKLLVIFGATGQQGGAIINTVLADRELSKTYTLRGITRDPSAPAATALTARGVEMTRGDADDPSSLTSALRGAHTVFALTATIYRDGGETKTREVTQGKAIADAAVAAGAQYLIFSTLPHVAAISRGKYTGVDHFDGKADVEAYIRGLPIASAFFAPGSFMQNFHAGMGPRPAGDGTYVLANVVAPQTRLPLIDTAADAGKFVGAILADPDKYKGEVFCAATRLYSYSEIVDVMSKATGKTVAYMQIPVDAFKAHLPPAMAGPLVEMLQYFQDFDYYGPDSAERIAWAVANARGSVTSFEEYLAKNPLALQ